MTTHPLILKPWEVPPLLDGRKTQVRRPVTPQPVIRGKNFDHGHWSFHSTEPVKGPSTFTYPQDPNVGMWVYVGRHSDGRHYDHSDPIRCPLGQPGDVLVCKETWGIRGWCDDGAVMAGRHPEGLRLRIVYQGDDENDEIDGRHFYPDSDGYARIRKLVKCYRDETRWRSPATMPPWASRLRLTVLDVRVERVQDVDMAGARADGFQSTPVPGCGENGWWCHRSCKRHDECMYRTNPLTEFNDQFFKDYPQCHQVPSPFTFVATVETVERSEA